MAFKDHFSRQATDYAASRPSYPPALLAWLAGQCARRDLVWDAGCGSGQASVALGGHFARVEASDPSREQLAGAVAHPGLRYHVAAEQLPALADGTVDLITAAQAYHWFDQAAFAAEARRVAAHDSVLAVWTYNLPAVDTGIDAVVAALYDDLGPWWPPERRHVEDGYAHLPLPGRPLPAPPFVMAAAWDLPRFVGYLASWSAVAACRAGSGHDPLAAGKRELASAWGPSARSRLVSWPLTVRAARL
ncbi:MAG: class I SAM-dependent methyltransferase [bacterium]|nr:class I SAM-dependent methyltransferase [bacterium]